MSPAIRDLCRIMVKWLDFRSLAASSGAEGKNLAFDHQSFLILLDRRLAVQDEAGICRRIRARGYSVAITPMSMLQNSAGFERAKPIVYQTLKKLLSEAAEYATDGP